MSLTQIVYVSKAVKFFDNDELGELLQICKKNNSVTGITGVLLYSPGFFMQLIEGEPDSLSRLYNHILIDDRHTAIRCLIERKIMERLFPDWSMGLINFNKKEPDDYYIRKVEELIARPSGDNNLAFDILLEFLVKSK